MNDKPMLSSASLVDLKAELLRKQESVKQTKLQRGVYEGVVLSKLKRSENDGSTCSKKPPLEKTTVLPSTAEEENALRKSRTMLERKALLYDKLSKGLIIPDEEQSERFLINFQKKSLDNPEATNVALSETPLESIPSVKIPALPIAHNITKVSDVIPPHPTLSNEEISESTENTESGPTHYQNIQHKEVRNHGVGYFSFSMEEDERKKQMDILNTLRQQTVGQREAREKQKRKQQSQLKARLAKVRQRKNIAPLEEDDSHSSNESQNSSKDEATDEIMDETNNADIQEEPKPIRVRPWDKGKDFPDLLPERKVVHKRPGDLWKESKRKERPADFAPPVYYNKESQKKSSWSPKINKVYCTERAANNYSPTSNIPPESLKETRTFSEGEGSRQNDQEEVKYNPEEVVAQKLAFFRQQFN